MDKDVCQKAHGFRIGNNSLSKLSLDLYRYVINFDLLIYMHTCRSTPVEVLHTILLGVCEYIMLKSFMKSRSSVEKQEILARIASLPSSGLSCRITGNIAYHYKSFVGRDYKAWMQIAIFIVHPYLTESETRCWLLLSKVYIHVVHT